MKAVTDRHHSFSSSPLPATNISIPVTGSGGGGVEAAVLGKGRYKAWALGAIALLALWSMLASSVSLRFSSDDLSAAGDFDDSLRDELDALEMEEREKLVHRMWDMYTNTGDWIHLPRFWHEAFEAAYEELAGDDMQARDDAISEIARMSVYRLRLELPPNEIEEAKTVNLGRTGKGKLKVKKSYFM